MDDVLCHFVPYLFAEVAEGFGEDDGSGAGQAFEFLVLHLLGAFLLDLFDLKLDELQCAVDLVAASTVVVDVPNVEFLAVAEDGVLDEVEEGKEEAEEEEEDNQGG